MLGSYFQEIVSTSTNDDICIMLLTPDQLKSTEQKLCLQNLHNHIVDSVFKSNLAFWVARLSFQICSNLILLLKKRTSGTQIK